MTIFDIFDALFCAMAVYVLVTLWNKYLKRPKVWVLDDSEVDLSLFKLKIKLDRFYDVRYFTCHEEMRRAYMLSVLTLSEPACVIVDYFLGAQTRGDKIMKFFRANGVPSVIMTGYEGEISNLTQKDVIIKSPDETFKTQIENWVFNATGRKV